MVYEVTVYFGGSLVKIPEATPEGARKIRRKLEEGEPITANFQDGEVTILPGQVCSIRITPRLPDDT